MLRISRSWLSTAFSINIKPRVIANEDVLERTTLEFHSLVAWGDALVGATSAPDALRINTQVGQRANATLPQPITMAV